jgi:hypothetical protein
MRYTANLNLPVAESGDPKKTYADNVDGPRTDAIDNHLGAMVHLEGGTASPTASSTTTIANYGSVYGQSVWADEVSGQVTVPTAGVYQIMTRIRIQPPTTEYGANNSIRDASGGLQSQWMLAFPSGLGNLTIGCSQTLWLPASHIIWQATYITGFSGNATVELGTFTVRLLLPDGA